MATSQITAGSQVTNGAGRTGVCLYDNPSVVNNNNASAYVAYADNTWQQVPRSSLTVVTGGFFEGVGPGN